MKARDGVARTRGAERRELTVRRAAAQEVTEQSGEHFCEEVTGDHFKVVA